MKTFLKIIFIITFFAFNCFAKSSDDYWSEKNIKLPVNYIFSYGIYVNSDSRKTLDKLENQVYTAIPARVSSKFGYIRSWCYRSDDNYAKTIIGIRKARKDELSTINGIIQPVKDGDVFPSPKALNYGFDIIEIPSEYIEASGWQQLPKNAKFWTYVVKPDRLGYADSKHPITQSYLDITLQGYLEYGEEYAMEFIATTKDWSKYWLNDRVMARSPWFFKDQYKDYDIIDETLANYFSNTGSNFLKYRKFSEEYGK